MGPSYQEVKKAVTATLVQGDTSSALRQAQQSDLSPEMVAELLCYVASALKQDRKYKESLEVLQKALCLQEKALGQNSKQTASTLNNVAVVAALQGNYDLAESAFRKALGAWQGAVGGNHPQLAPQLLNLAAILERQGRLEEALPLLERAKSVCEDATQDPERTSLKWLLRAQTSLGLLCIRLLRVAEADENFKKVLRSVYAQNHSACADASAIWERAHQLEEEWRASATAALQAVDGEDGSGRRRFRRRRERTLDDPPEPEEEASMRKSATEMLEDQDSCLAQDEWGRRSLQGLTSLYHLAGRHRAAAVLEACLQDQADREILQP